MESTRIQRLRTAKHTLACERKPAVAAGGHKLATRPFTHTHTHSHSEKSKLNFFTLPSRVSGESISCSLREKAERGLHHQETGPPIDPSECVCVCACDAHSNLGGVVENADPLHQILLVIGLQVKLPHPSIND